MSCISGVRVSWRAWACMLFSTLSSLVSVLWCIERHLFFVGNWSYNHFPRSPRPVGKLFYAWSSLSGSEHGISYLCWCVLMFLVAFTSLFLPRSSIKISCWQIWYGRIHCAGVLFLFYLLLGIWNQVSMGFHVPFRCSLVAFWWYAALFSSIY